MRHIFKIFGAFSEAENFEMFAVSGWIVSTDPLDPSTSLANSTFAGSEHVQSYFDKYQVNMGGIMYDFDTHLW